jgi:hypothetical protein
MIEVRPAKRSKTNPTASTSTPKKKGKTTPAAAKTKTPTQAKPTAKAKSKSSGKGTGKGKGKGKGKEIAGKQGKLVGDGELEISDDNGLFSKLSLHPSVSSSSFFPLPWSTPGQLRRRCRGQCADSGPLPSDHTSQSV